MSVLFEKFQKLQHAECLLKARYPTLFFQNCSMVSFRAHLFEMSFQRETLQ